MTMTTLDPQEFTTPNTGSAPPKKGICKRCGENKTINRLMLCYPCWVKTELERHNWREGMSHPDWCGCNLGEHQRRSTGN